MMRRRVTRLLLIGALWVGTVGSASAMWADVPLEQLVREADVIVAGEIMRVEPAGEFEHAMIRVRKVLKNSLAVHPVEVGTDIPLRMPTQIRVSTDLQYRKGREGVWLLQYRDGVFLTKHPKSLQPLEKLVEIEQLLEMSARRPNVIVVLADDQRADYLGVAGHPIVKTPNIDRLARRGTYFPNAFVSSAACMPSRNTILTGQYERKHGVTFDSQSALNDRAFSRTYPMVLKQAGYFTGYVGKNHSPIGKSEKGLGYESGVMEQGFDFWYGNHRHSTFYPKTRHPIYKNAAADTQVEIFTEGSLNFLTPNETFLAGAREFLKERPADKPFCLLVNLNVPHGAGTGSMRQKKTDPALYRTAYRDQIKKMPQPETYVAAAKIGTPKIPRKVYNGEYIRGYNYVMTPKALRERQVLTCQTVTGIDRLVGRLVKELKQLGEAERTIIVYLSDHGLQHGEHGLGGKVLLYEESLRIPLIIYDPRLPADEKGRRVEEMAVTIDVAPTILDLAGVSAPPGIQGRSLVPFMRGENVAWREDFFCENLYMGQNYPRMEGVRSRDWKYIRYFDKKLDTPHAQALTASIRGEPPIYEELYDLKNDPQERENLVGLAEYSETLEQYRRRCQALVVQAKGGDGEPETER